MGRVKQHYIELESRNISKTIDKNVCSSHIDDKYIKSYIQLNSEFGNCSYCNKKKKVISLELLMEFLMAGINKFYEDAANFMSYDTSEGGYLGEIFTPYELINDQIALEIDNYELNEDIISCIEDVAWSEPNMYYDSESDILKYHWDYFKYVVKHKSRYLFTKSKKFKTSTYNQNAYDILEDVSKYIIDFKLIKTLNSNCKIFRCRQHTSSDRITASKQITSPPENKANFSNRFSPAGISMFYGAFDIDTAKKETIDTENTKSNNLTCAEFKTKRKIAIVDFSTLPEIPSIFGVSNLKDYYARVFLRSFLKDLTSDIIKNGNEHIDYIPTQIVTEYFRFEFNEQNKTDIAGFIYNSSKNKEKKACVLFYDNEECEDALELISLKTDKI